MSNNFYNATGTPSTGAFGASAAQRSEFDLVGSGFDKMPALTAGTAVVVNGSGTALTNTVGTLALAGNFATTGAFNLTLSVGASVTLTCPATSDTLVGRATTDTLTNKTLTAPVMTAPVLGTPASGTLTNCTGLPNGGLLNSSVTIGSTSVALGATAAIIAGLTLTAPVFTTPALGTPASGVLTSCTGLPISTGVSGLGTGVATLLGGNASGTGGPVGSTSPTVTTPVVAGLLDLTGASGGQVKFPAAQNPSADANTLDDYEEGTFTPVLSFGGGVVGITYTTQGARYTKVGNRVIFNLYFKLSNKGSSTGNAQLAGLPFTSKTSGIFCALAVRSSGVTGGIIPQAYVNDNATTIALDYLNAGTGNAVNMANTDFFNSTEMMISGSYEASQ